MRVAKDFWLSLTVVFSFLAIILGLLCAASWVAVANGKREPTDTPPPRRIRLDLRLPSTLFAFGVTTLAWYSHRRYQRCLRDAS